MAIAHVQSGGTATDNATSASRATASNVTAGGLLVIEVTCYKGANNDPFVVGDISKSAGTATVGAFTLDIQRNFNYTGSFYMNTAIFSCLVTGTGTCTITVGGAPSGSYWNVVVGEFSGNWDAARVEATNSAEATTGAPSSGDATSAGAALFIGGLTTNTAVSTTHTQDAAFSLMDEEEDGSAHITGAGIYEIVGGGTTDAASWTAPTTAEWAAVVAVYKEAAGGGGDPIRLLFPTPLDGVGSGGRFLGNRLQ